MGIEALIVTAIVTSLAATGAAVAGSIEEGKAAEAAAKFNAEEGLAAGKREEERLRRFNRRQGQQHRAALSKSGLAIEGSPLDSLATNATEFERDALNVRRAAGKTAALDIAQGRAARKAGQIGAAAAGLSGLSSTVGTGLTLSRFA